MIEVILLAVFVFCVYDMDLYRKHISNYVWSSHERMDPLIRLLPGSGFYVWWKTRKIYKQIDKTKKENEK